MLTTGFDKLSEQLHCPAHANPIPGGAEVEKQATSSRQEQGCLGLIGFRLPGCLLGESFPVDERIFENAGIVFRVAEGERVQLEKQAQLRLLGSRAHPLPEPA